MREKRPRWGESVRFEGQNAKVVKPNYEEETVIIKLLKGGADVIELDRFDGCWNGRYWDIPKEDELCIEDERRDVQIFFDWCLTGTHPGVAPLPAALRIRRLELLLTYIKDPTDVRHSQLKEYKEKVNG